MAQNRRHVIIRAVMEKRGRNVAKGANAREQRITVTYPAGASAIVRYAATDLARGLGADTSAESVKPDPSLRTHVVITQFGQNPPAEPSSTNLDGDSFELLRPSLDSIAIGSGSDRALLHGVIDLQQRLGKNFSIGASNSSGIDPAAVLKLKPYRVTPAFRRRAMVSDILTWNYSFPDRLEQHLKFDREFIPWMARRGINAFEYIRHAHDTRARIDELVPLYDEWGIGCEYGGHVLEILMPRDRFHEHPEYFPMDAEGNRAPRGNMCVSNPEGLRLVRDGALSYLREFPENQMLHIWGADVRGGGWCNCPGCKQLSPQLQYMKIVNEIAAAEESASVGIPVIYLAYHDTIDPDPDLRPLPNVHFEWAPRERCYIHAIDDSSCKTNARYFKSLKRYIDIFEGRGHVFEYYADSILFGGLAFAMPSVIARDLRAYKRVGIGSVSNLTFGAYSALAYPVNLEAFVRGTRSPDFDPKDVIDDVAAGRHPEQAEAIAKVYRQIENASALMLDYADVVAPYRITPQRRPAKKEQLEKALSAMERAVERLESIRESTPLLAAEQELCNYSLEIVSALGDYVRALDEKGIVRTTLGESAIANINGAIEHIRKIDLDIKGAWGAYDLEWLRELWLDSLRRNLAAKPGKAGKAIGGSKRSRLEDPSA
jgi:Domain of unknown function (DUF4838)